MSKKLLLNQLELKEVITFTEDTIQQTEWLDLTKYGDFDIIIFDCNVNFNTSECLTYQINKNESSNYYPNNSGTSYTNFLTCYKLNNKCVMCEAKSGNKLANLPTSIRFRTYYADKENKILAGSTITIYTGKFNI